MTSKIGLGLLLFELCLKVHASSILVFDSLDNDLCGRRIDLGGDVMAAKFNYYWTYTGPDCGASIDIDERYSAAYSLQSIDGRCDSILSIHTRYRTEQFSFCGYYSTTERVVKPGSRVSLFANHTSYIPSRDRFSLMIYAFRERDQSCSSGSYRCTNGRCLHRDLYCNMKFSFCGDGSYQDCYNDVTSPTSPTSFGNIVGVLALVITLILVVIVVLYFCCCRRARRLRQNNNNNNNNRTLTARDVYVIPTSQDNPDGEDYVIDYQKFAEPPAYETLEMTDISGASAHASATEYIGTVRPNINNTESHHAAVGTTENNEPQIGTQANTDTSRIANEETVYSEISNVSESRPAPGNGNVNAGFSPDDEELPSYRDVLSDRGKFGVVDT